MAAHTAYMTCANVLACLWPQELSLQDVSKAPPILPYDPETWTLVEVGLTSALSFTPLVTYT